MRVSCIKMLFSLTILHMSITGLNGHKFFYRAAVFEIFQFPNFSYPGSEIISKNLEKYELAAEISADNEADIIVFPEEGLFSTSYENDTWFISYAEDVPNPKIEHVNPCDDDKYQNSPILKRLSCMAKKHEFYVVADLIDVKKCEVTDGCDENDIDYCVTDPDECPEDGYYHFNTLVVFDREGYLITRYYKIHLYFEEGLNTPKTIKHEYFTTEFGEFTVGICFDLLFQGFVKSARNATGLVYPTWWFDHTPLIYFATSFQQSWSIANKVNILAADVQYPNFGSLGSGIYTPGNGALIYTSNPDARSKLLISNVPVSPIAIPVDTDLLDQNFYYIDDDYSFQPLVGEEPRDYESECGVNVLGTETSSLTDFRCQHTEVNTYTFVTLNESKGHVRVCSNKFCCSLTYEADSMDESYSFGVSGHRLNFYQTYLFGVQACFLARCEPLDGKPCRNYLLKSDTIFRSVKIEGTFRTRHIYPFAVDNEIRLTDRKEWDFDGESLMLYQNLNNRSLLSIGLYGRLYRRDKSLNT